MTKLHHLPPNRDLTSRMRPAGGRGLLFALLVALACGLGVNQTAARPLSHQAGLVVQFGESQVQTYCVNFDTDTISGLQLLQNVSSLQIIYDATSTGMGAGVCKINNDGCSFPMEDCFCQCQGLACVYWSYWHLQPNNTWDYSPLGASSFVVTNGQVDGWRWGAGTTNSAQPPPVITLSEICQPAPTATPTLTPTPLPTATPTPTPSATSTPSATPTLTPMVQISFSAAPTTLAPGQCSSVAWKVAGPWTAIYYQEAIVTAEEQRQECPPQTETLRLRVDTESGALTRSITLQVTGAGITATPTVTAPSALTATPTRIAPAQTPPTSTPTFPQAATSPTVTAMNTPAVTSTATATMMPRPTLRVTPPTQTVVHNEPTAAPTKAAGTAAPPASPGGGLLWQYALFGLILLVLGGAVIFAFGRRAQMEDEE
jgi:hypothetical protein